MRINVYTYAELILIRKMLRKANKMVDKRCHCLFSCSSCKYRHICGDIQALEQRLIETELNI